MSATIGNFIGHRSSCNVMGLADVSGLPTEFGPLIGAKCEKIFRGNAQCLSSEMIYRNDVLFFFLFHFPFLHRRRTTPYSRILNAFFDSSVTSSFTISSSTIFPHSYFSSEIIHLSIRSRSNRFPFSKNRLRIGTESEVKNSKFSPRCSFLITVSPSSSLLSSLSSSFGSSWSMTRINAKRCVVVVFS